MRVPLNWPPDRCSLVLGGVVGLAVSTCAGPYDPQAEFWEADSARGGGAGVPRSLPEGGGGAGPRDAGDRGAGGSFGTGNAGSSGAFGTGGDGGSAGNQGTAGSLGTGGESGGNGGGGGSPVFTGPCKLAVTVTTVDPGGKYSPRNVGAIWVTDASGVFIKTLALWGRRRNVALTGWYDATYLAGLEGNTVDAVTGATLSSHKMHDASWNCTDVHEDVVPDGSYTVHFEVTDSNASGPTASFDFMKGTAPFTLSPPDESNFVGIRLVYAP